MENYITVEEFIKEHRNDRIQIMSPGGFVNIHPNRKLTELSAHAGEPGTDRAMPWDEIKDQVIKTSNCSFNEAEAIWYVLSEVPPELDTVPPVSKLKDHLNTLWEDIHLLHKDVEINPYTIVELQNTTLTDEGKDAWSDILNADVLRVYSGIYGLQMELGNVKSSRLEDFSAMLVGNCSIQDYEKWVADPGNLLKQLPMMKL